MDIRRITRSPALVSAVGLLATALMLAANPGRQQVLHSLYGRLHEPVRLIPLAPDAMIPTFFAKWLWGCALFAGWSWLPFNATRRKLLYGIVSLPTYGALGIVLWTTTVQWWGLARWAYSTGLGTRRRDGSSSAFVFAYAWGVAGTVRYWMRDIGQRCPECLDRLCMPVQLGREGGVLIGAGEIESICLRGHGSLSQARWSSNFRPATGFWKELLK